MDIDRILEHGDYNLRSPSHLSARDMPRVLTWLRTDEPIFGVLLRLHKQRAARRKEVYETLFVLDRLAPELRRARSICDVGAGHGLVGLFAAILHPHLQRVVHVDRRRPLCYDKALELLALDRPWLKRRARYLERPLDDLAALPPADLVVGVHCCGALTDEVARLARVDGRPFAVMPCCESRKLLPEGVELTGEAIAARVLADRVARWRGWGYGVTERTIPARVTARPRVLVATPAAGPPSFRHGAAP